MHRQVVGRTERLVKPCTMPRLMNTVSPGAKTLRSQKLRMLLTHRKLLQSKAIAIENDLRGTLRNFGLKVGMVGTVRFETRVQELIETIPDLVVLVEPMLVVRRALREQIVILHRRLLAIVRDDEVCRRLMTTPGVGATTS
jgi:transposase